MRARVWLSKLKHYKGMIRGTKTTIISIRKWEIGDSSVMRQEFLVIYLTSSPFLNWANVQWCDYSWCCKVESGSSTPVVFKLSLSCLRLRWKRVMETKALLLRRPLVSPAGLVSIDKMGRALIRPDCLLVFLPVVQAPYEPLVSANLQEKYITPLFLILTYCL